MAIDQFFVTSLCIKLDRCVCDYTAWRRKRPSIFCDLTPRRMLFTDVSAQNIDHVFGVQAFLLESLVLERWD